MTADERTAVALERIATALEQIALDRLAAPLEMVTVGLPTDEPPLPTPPPDLPLTAPTAPLSGTVTVPLPPVIAPQYQFTGAPAQCPVHHVNWKVVPAGVSKRTGAAYSAFLACPERGCDQKPQASR